MEIRLNFVDTTVSVTGWNRLIPGFDYTNLVDETDTATTIDITWLGVSPLNAAGIGAGGSPGTGDASWVAGTDVSDSGWALDTAWTSYRLTGLNPAHQYIWETYGITSSGSGILESSINEGTDILSHATVTNGSETNRHAAAYPDSNGELVVSLRDGGNGGWVAAARLVEVVGPEVTLDQAELTPGGAISGSYSNYDTVPASPLTLTDSNGNTKTITVTVTDNGDGTGTFTGTMPDLPASGSDTLLLFGDVDVELS